MSKDAGVASGRILVTLAALVIVIAGMRAAEAIITPFLLSIFIAVIAAPPMFFLQRRGLPSWLAMILVLAGIFGVGFMLITLVGNSVNDLITQLPEYQERLKAYTNGLVSLLSRWGLEISSEMVSQVVDPGKVLGLFTKALTGIGGVLTNAVLILFTVVFLLMEAAEIPSKLRRALKNPESNWPRFQGFSDNLQRYLAIKATISVVTAILVAIPLVLLGLDYPALWAVMMFFLNFVPNIGPIIAAVPAVLLALVQLGPFPALLVVLVYLGVNTLMGNIVEPRFMGRSLGLSTLVVFLSLVFWGWVLGPIGMLLSVPLTMAAKIALDSNEDTRGLAVMLGPGHQDDGKTKAT